MSNWDKPYPYHYTIDECHPELTYVWGITTRNINKFITTYSNTGSSSHHYIEKDDGTINVESEMWYDVKRMSNRAMQLCNYETPDLVCVTMIVGAFANGETRIFKYDNVDKYKVNVRFYKSGNANCSSHTHDDSPHQCGNPNIRVGEFTGLFGNLLHPESPLDESNIVEATDTPFTFWNSFTLWLMSPFNGPEITVHIGNQN